MLAGFVGRADWHRKSGHCTARSGSQPLRTPGPSARNRHAADPSQCGDYLESSHDAKTQARDDLKACRSRRPEQRFHDGQRARFVDARLVCVGLPITATSHGDEAFDQVSIKDRLLRFQVRPAAAVLKFSVEQDEGFWSSPPCVAIQHTRRTVVESLLQRQCVKRGILGKRRSSGSVRRGRGRGQRSAAEAPGRPNRDRPPEGAIRSLIPARLDRLGWSRFHTRLVMALGVAWVLDGLEITIASNAEGLISQKQALNLSSSEVAFAVGTVYLLGEVVGALFFGRMSDKFGRRNLFMITLGVYLFGGVLTALTFGHSPGWAYWVWASRFIAGMGIGGEYAAINSAIDELIPAKYRGRVDIAVNGTYWGGALIATVLTILVVNHLPASYSWRVAFLFGPVLGFVILFVRKNLPESPRWLLMHGREEEAESAVDEIEQHTKRKRRHPG